MAVLVIFVRLDGEVRERLGELGDGALDDPGLVGVLQPDQVTAAGVVRHVDVDGRRVHPADVQEAGRAGREAGDLRPFREIPDRPVQDECLGGGYRSAQCSGPGRSEGNSESMMSALSMGGRLRTTCGQDRKQRTATSGGSGIEPVPACRVA